MIVVSRIEEVRRAVAEARAAGNVIGIVPTMGALHAGHASLIDAAVKRVAARTGACGEDVPSSLLEFERTNKQRGKDEDADKMSAIHEGKMPSRHAGGTPASRNCAGSPKTFTVVTIFVNPTQFGPTEDLAKYPRTPEKDYELCRAHGADLVFTPGVEEMYGPSRVGQAGRLSYGECLTEITVKALAAGLCGRSRPTHFAGVCTVVAKLLNIVLPDVAYFGAKDYQQAAIIRRMVADLNFPVRIEVCPTVREPDGLAMSSRNAYLSAEHRRQAPALKQALDLGRELIAKGQSSTEAVKAAMREHIVRVAPAGEIDYLEIVDPDSLCNVETARPPVVIALAVRLGGTRLIDNIAVDAPCPDF